MNDVANLDLIALNCSISFGLIYLVVLGCSFLSQVSLNLKLLLISIPFGLGVWTYSYGLHHFGAYDCSPLVDIGWRLLLGQKPFTDFPFTLPPGFALGVKYAYSLFGLRWSSLVLWNIGFCFAFAAGAVGLLWRNQVRAIELLVCVATALILPVWFTGHWWHSSMTSIVGGFSVVAATCFFRNSKDGFNQLALFLSLTLLLLTKPNVGFPLYGLILLVGFFFSNAKKEMVGMSVLSVIAAWGWLTLEGISVPQLLQAYSAIAKGRMGGSKLIPPEMVEWERMLTIATLILTLLPIVPVFFYPSRDLFQKKRAEILLLSSGMLVAYFGLKTNWDIKQNDLPLLLTSISLGSYLIREGVQARAAQMMIPILLAVVCSFVTSTGMALGSSRWRSRLVGEGTFYERTTVAEKISAGYFQGLSSGSRFQKVLDQVKEVVDRVPNRKTIFFGPRMEFLYATFQVPSPKGLPLWWHPGSSYALKEEATLVQNFKKTPFEAAIFLKSDFTRVPYSILEFLCNKYERDDRNSDITVFRRKTSVSPLVKGMNHGH